MRLSIAARYLEITAITNSYSEVIAKCINSLKDVPSFKRLIFNGPNDEYTIEFQDIPKETKLKRALVDTNNFLITLPKEYPDLLKYLTKFEFNFQDSLLDSFVAKDSKNSKLNFTELKFYGEINDSDIGKFVRVLELSPNLEKITLDIQNKKGLELEINLSLQ